MSDTTLSVKTLPLRSTTAGTGIVDSGVQFGHAAPGEIVRQHSMADFLEMPAEKCSNTESSVSSPKENAPYVFNESLSMSSELHSSILRDIDLFIGPFDSFSADADHRNILDWDPQTREDALLFYAGAAGTWTHFHHH